MNEDTQDSGEGLSRILSKAERMLEAAEAAMDDGFVESAASMAPITLRFMPSKHF